MCLIKIHKVNSSKSECSLDVSTYINDCINSILNLNKSQVLEIRKKNHLYQSPKGPLISEGHFSV